MGKSEGENYGFPDHPSFRGVCDRYLNIIRLQRYLTDGRCSQVEFAKRLGMHRSVVQAILASADPIPFRIAERFAEAAGCSPEDILLPKGMGITLTVHHDGSRTRRFG